MGKTTKILVFPIDGPNGTYTFCRPHRRSDATAELSAPRLPFSHNNVDNFGQFCITLTILDNFVQFLGKINFGQFDNFDNLDNLSDL